jgi:hypothetical protein
MVLLDSGVQTLMLGKTIVDGLILTNADLDPCPYHILTSMGGSKKAQGLTKQEIVIQGEVTIWGGGGGGTLGTFTTCI